MCTLIPIDVLKKSSGGDRRRCIKLTRKAVKSRLWLIQKGVLAHLFMASLINSHIEFPRLRSVTILVQKPNDLYGTYEAECLFRLSIYF